MKLAQALEAISIWIQGNTGILYEWTKIEQSVNTGDVQAEGIKIAGILAISNTFVPTGLNPGSMIFKAYTVYIHGVVTIDETEMMVGDRQLYQDQGGISPLTCRFEVQTHDGGKIGQRLTFWFKNDYLFRID